MNSYKLIQGDCLEILPTLQAESIDLVIADPPYNIGKAEWDNIPNYVDWCKQWIIEIQRVLKTNGSFYVFHNDILQLSKLICMIKDETSFILRSFITWEKYQTNKQYYGREVLMGVNNEGLRCYYPMSEYILFYTFEDFTGAEQLSEKYCSINPMAKYLREEFEKADVTNKEIARLFPSRTGGLTGCVSNWLLGNNFPLKSQYMNIRKCLNSKKQGEYLKREYEDLKREYEDLKREYEEQRYCFNNCEKDVTRTWLFRPAPKKGHITPKPVKLLRRILNYSSNENDIVLDPFCGSGSTMKACQDLSRNFIGIELNPEYCKLINKRCLGQQFLNREVNYEMCVEAKET